MSITSSVSAGRIVRHIEQAISSEAPLVQVAQRCCEIFFETFAESTVLVRLFLTLAYSKLPAQDRAFADEIARRRQVAHLVTQATPVLTLLGSRGVEASWNDRCLSVGHRAIPLASSALVESMPMTARLFRDIDPDLSWIAERDRDLVKKTWGAGPAGLFFVKDPESALDSQGRRVVVAQDFVRQYSVKTVFGIGRRYGPRILFAMIVFLRQSLARRQALEFLPIASTLRGVTLRAIDAQRVFAGDGSQ